jgi:lipoprotein-anchoring transpeptidase ErfK/SrfK
VTEPTASARTARTDRRRRNRRRNRIIGVSAVVIVLVAVGGWFFSQDDGTAVRTAAPTTTTTAPKAVNATASTIATSIVPELVAYTEPNEASPPVGKFTQITEYLQPRTLLVVEQQDGWLKALLPMRPNNSTGWIRSQDVTLSSTTMSVLIDLSDRSLSLSDGTTGILSAKVGIGKPETPTPLGTFYVTDPVDLTAKPNGAYGAFALGLSGYSEVLMTFRGGPGQIAIHGTSNASDLGNEISNGCIRVINDQVVPLAQQLPLGTPVTIVA